MTDVGQSIVIVLELAALLALALAYYRLSRAAFYMAQTLALQNERLSALEIKTRVHRQMIDELRGVPHPGTVRRDG